jgi:hypothetical protein
MLYAWVIVIGLAVLSLLCFLASWAVTKYLHYYIDKHEARWVREGLFQSTGFDLETFERSLD